MERKGRVAALVNSRGSGNCAKSIASIRIGSLDVTLWLTIFFFKRQELCHSLRRETYKPYSEQGRRHK
jgi:hypothetical protein